MVEKDTPNFTSRIISLIVALALFSVLYSLTNVYAQVLFNSLQPIQFNAANPIISRKIYTLALPIDDSVPFIAAMIVPYSWSILLFCVSFFLVKSTQQLSVLTSRIILATLLAAIVFYFFPANFTFDRPAVTDWTQFGYHFLSVADKPFNQFPSLHVTYALLIGITVWNVSKRWIYRLVLTCICTLIIVSTVFTYQHHLLDILGGFLLSILVLIIANKLRSPLVLKYLTVALAGFLMVSIVGYLTAQYYKAYSLEWIATLIAIYWLGSFMTLAWLYQYPMLTRRKKSFQKNPNGRLQLSSWLAFAPLLLIYRLMWSLKQRFGKATTHREQITCPISLDNVDKAGHYNSITAIATSKLMIAKSLDTLSDLAKGPGQNTVHDKIIVIDLAAEIDSHFACLQAVLTHQTDVDYVYFPLLDLQSFLELDISDVIVLFKDIDHLIKIKSTAKIGLSTSTLINFHCVMGLSRSVGLHTLYLVYKGVLEPHSYSAWIKKCYPNAHVSATYLPISVVHKVSKYAPLNLQK